MPLPMQKLREIVFQVLYSRMYEACSGEETGLMLMAELHVTKKAVLEASGQVAEIEAKILELDQEIAKVSTEYRLERISRVEKTILRLGVFELFFCPTVPPRVAIAEAVRLTRKFGTPESANFVNAILDQVHKKKNDPLLAEKPASF